VLVFVVYSRRRESHIKYPGPDDDVRENIINYDDEGGGEDDMTAFDITPLQIPIGGPMPELMQSKMPPIMCKCWSGGLFEGFQVLNLSASSRRGNLEIRTESPGAEI
jgi:Cadherin cytoplasmic region